MTLLVPAAENQILFTMLAAWLAFLYMDRDDLLGWRNVDLVMLFAWVPMGDYEVGYIPTQTVMAYLPLFYFVARGLLSCRDSGLRRWHLAGGDRLLWLALLCTLAFGVLLVFIAPLPLHEMDYFRWPVSPTGLAGYAGARLLLEGHLPYGNVPADPPGMDTYGLTYYVLFIPFTFLFDGEFGTSVYYPGHRVIALMFHLLSVAGMYLVGLRLGGKRMALGMALFWAATPSSLLPLFWSQLTALLPACLCIFAISRLHRPFQAGVLLAMGATAAYFPAFILPAWLGHYRGRSRVLFLAGFTLIALTTLIPLLFSESGIGNFFEASVLHQEGATFGARSPTWGRWSPWAHYPIMRPLKRVFLLLFILIALVSFRLGRGTDVRRLCALSGAVIVASQLWKSHAPGFFVLWFLPFLMVGLLGPSNEEPGGAPESIP